MSSRHFTLLVEDLRPLARSLPPERRYPAIERVVCRGRRSHRAVSSANHLRLELLEQAVPGPVPVAALTRVADTGSLPETGSWWLRADPVTLRPDLTQVYMVAHGFGQASGEERQAIDRLVQNALERDGLNVSPERNGRWSVSLEGPLDFEFTPLDQALGLDQAAALPETLSARRWKRLITEIQVELHQRSRERGGADHGSGINSVWFWGAGPMPAVGPTPFDAIAADDPVTRGLAAASNTLVLSLDRCLATGDRVLIDWSPQTADAEQAASALNDLVGRLLEAGDLALVEGGGSAWLFDRAASRRFWKRSVSLRGALGEATG